MFENLLASRGKALSKSGLTFHSIHAALSFMRRSSRPRSCVGNRALQYEPFPLKSTGVVFILKSCQITTVEYVTGQEHVEREYGGVDKLRVGSAAG